MFSAIFDMDGTLLDTQQIYIPAWEDSGAKQGIKGVGEHISNVCGMNEAGWTSYLETHFPTLDIQAFKQNVLEYISENGVIRLKEGALELLDFLKSKNIKMAVASGASTESIIRNLKEVGVFNYFGAFAGSLDVENGKPAPDVFLLAAKRLGVAPEECFVFEDSANGIKAGYRAGMKCIGVPDVAEFDSDIKAIMFAELKSLDEAIELLRNME
ncbi:MAG: HAD family phosphatase [Clostridia bacterium]|nr:HAD family phosphatase [Clostridia bacterium]